MASTADYTMRLYYGIPARIQSITDTNIVSDKCIIYHRQVISHYHVNLLNNQAFTNYGMNPRNLFDVYTCPTKNPKNIPRID